MNVLTMQDTRQKSDLCLGARADYAKMTDLELIAACQNQDCVAFQYLYKRNERIVIGILRRLAPERHDHSDLTQDVFIRLWSAISTLRNPDAFKKWMTLITKHVFYDELRLRRPITISLDSTRIENDNEDVMSLQIADQSPPPDELMELRELREMIDLALVKLPCQFHQAIVLRDMEGLSYEVIGQSTNTPIGTIKSRIARARKKMQLHLSTYLSCSELHSNNGKLRA